MQFVYALILLVASYVITALTQPKPKQADPASLRDFQFPQFQEGTEQIVVFGEVWTGDWMVTWYGQLSTSNNTSGSSGGKK